MKNVMFKQTYLSVGLMFSLAACTGGGVQGGGGTGGTITQPTVTAITLTSEDNPKNVYKAGATGVARDISVTADIKLATPGIGVEPKTLNGNVKLFETSTPANIVAGTAGTDGAGGNITFSPDVYLKANTQYTFEVASGVKDEKGVSFKPFQASFTTGTVVPPDPLVRFNESVAYNGTRSLITSLTISPDNRLYGVTLDGKILRWTIATDGTLSGFQEIALPSLAGRALIGLTFRGNDSQTLWISNNAPLSFDPSRPPADFSGKISRVNLATGTVEDYVVGLPRSVKDHLTNSLVFGPDGFLYVPQGSNTSTGAPDPTWNPNGIHPERLLSATVLRVDPDRTSTELPINVQTEPSEGTAGNYDPFKAGAPVTIFANGVRNAYDLVWHTNGSLYIPTNGGAAGGYTPRSPDGTVPELKNVSNQSDYLFRTTLASEDRNLFFGHPVDLPNRRQYVLNGGNPTANVDLAEVVPDSGGRVGYPVGINPDPNWVGSKGRLVHEFGPNRSPDGAIEYKSSTFGGVLKNRLLVVEYSNGKDIVALKLDGTGKVTDVGRIGTTSNTRVKRFKDPLDLIEDTRNGNLYVVEMVPGPNATTPPTARIILLKP